MHVCMMRVWNMHISVICEVDACIYDAFFFVTNDEPTDKARYMYDVCMYVWHRNVWCLLACLHDACTHDACTHDAFTMYIAMIYLDPDACGYDAHVPNADEYMYTYVMRKSMMLIFFVTDHRTNQQWMMHACIYRSVSFVCMLHISIIFDLWP